MSRLLNIGAGPVANPRQYQGWEVVTLDIDQSVHPDLCMDARDLVQLAPGQYDAVYASHVLEHFSEADVDKVLWGFYHILTWDGYAEIRVPDVRAVMEAIVQGGVALDGVLYRAPVGPVRPVDVLWGWQEQIRRSGQPYYSHRYGFSRDTLGKALSAARFGYVEIGLGAYELHAMAYKHKPETE